MACATAATVVLAACGSGGNGNNGKSAGATGAATPPPPRVVVQASGSQFNPVEIYQRAAPGVVTVLSVFGGSGLLGQAAAGQGSGFVLNKDGEIVTNAHVVSQGEGSNLSKANQVYVEFADRNRVSAQVLGVDPFADVALIKVDPDGLDLVPLQLGNDANLQVGDPVAAIGSPFGEQQSLTVGIVSAKKRSVKSLTQFQIENAIQTDAAINPGNSGGPLLDANANVVGINQQIETRSDTNAGVGFAVPISAIKRSLDQLRTNGKAEYAYIGVSSQALYPQLSQHLGLDTDYGGLIAKVVPGGPADQAGLKGADHTIHFQASPVRVGGDLILAVNGKKVVGPSDLSIFISQYKPGDHVTLQILRDGQHQSIDVTLGTRPTGSSG
ncbi:MAG: trypsin-like peptidase domain-containing protein [Actinomycetota bacterium]|nr:trypsin-like peptidase domain-containing protein [Actinomycetota bacterium]